MMKSHRCMTCEHSYREHLSPWGCLVLSRETVAGQEFCFCQKYDGGPGLFHRLVHWLGRIAMDCQPCWICGREDY